MNYRLITLLSGLAVTSAACGDDTTGSGGSGGGATSSQTTTTSGQTTTQATTTSTASTGGGSHCEQVCADFDMLISTLMCDPQPDCVSDCEASFAQINPDCVDEAEALNLCLVDEPETSFQCSPNGGVTFNQGVCQTELDALIACGP